MKMPEYDVTVESVTLRRTASQHAEPLVALRVRVSPRLAWRVAQPAAALAAWHAAVPRPMLPNPAANATFARLARGESAGAAAVERAVRWRLGGAAARAARDTRALLDADTHVRCA